jgi:hypothetical protein
MFVITAQSLSKYHGECTEHHMLSHFPDISEDATQNVENDNVRMVINSQLEDIRN